MTKRTIHRTSRNIPIAAIQKQIKTVQATRKKQLIIVFFLALFLFYYSITTLSTSQPQTPTPHSSDILYGGYSSQLDLSHKVEDNDSSSYPFMQLLGINEVTISNASKASFSTLTGSSANPLIIWSRSANYQFSLETPLQMSPIFSIRDEKNDIFFYGSPVNKQLNDKLNDQLSFVAVSSKGIPFGVIKDSGNIVTTWEASQNINQCYQTPDNSFSYLNCPNGEQIITSVTTENITFKTDAHLIRARPGDTIKYRLGIENKSDKIIKVIPEVAIEDVLEYSTLKDYSTATFTNGNKTLKWPEVSINPGEKNIHEFEVIITNNVPLTARNANNSLSQDCAMSLYFGGPHVVFVQCPAQKVIERTIHSHFYPGILWFAWILFFMQCILLTRNTILLKDLLRQLHNERERLAP